MYEFIVFLANFRLQDDFLYALALLDHGHPGEWANPEAFFVFKLDSSETETSVKASTKSHGCPWIMGYRHL